jgi:hypothetical protein
MTRWCKLVALVVGWSVAAGGLAIAQDAPPAPFRWSLFKRDKTPPPPAPDASIATVGSSTAIEVPAYPGVSSYPGVPVDGMAVQGPPPRPQIGSPPPPPFVKPQTPPAEAPPGPDRPPNGFSDPIPPDAENGFEPCPQPVCEQYRPYYFGVDYIHWWVQKQPVPALVTTGPLSDAFPGAFGQPGTTFVIDDVSHGGAHDGARFTFGYDFDPLGCLGVEVNGFWLDTTSQTVSVSGNGSSGSAVLTRPFYNSVTHQPDADPINIPGAMAGTFIASAPLRLSGFDANLRWLVNPSPMNGPRFTLLFGFRYVDLDEKLLISEDLNDVPGLGAAGNHFSLGENFTTYNRFYGGQLGAAFDYHVGPVVLQFIGKCAYGRNDEELKISGSTTVLLPSGATANNPTAALYTGPGNVGTHSGGEFCVVPEGEFNIAYQFNDYVRMTLGYDVLWMSRVLRPGNQVNQLVNVQPVGGPPVAPLDPGVLPFRSSGLWAQGFSIGVEFNF